MTDHNDRHSSSYVDKVRGDMQKYVRSLISDNENLRVALAQVEAENSRLQQELRSARNEITFREAQEHDLRESLERIKTDTQKDLHRYAELEQANANLANLYVASYQLHGTLDRQSVLAAIQEIVVNLVGSEDFVVCEVDDRSGTFACIASVGVDDPDSATDDLAIHNSVATGELFLGSVSDSASPVACVPLKLDDRVTGYVAIFSLLGHKQALEPLDHELFDLLATHAATALYCTSLRQRVRESERLTA